MNYKGYGLFLCLGLVFSASHSMDAPTNCGSKRERGEKKRAEARSADRSTKKQRTANASEAPTNFGNKRKRVETKRADARSADHLNKKQRTSHFLETIKEGDVEQVRALVAQDAGLVNATDNEGRYPIHRAAEAGHIAMLEYLLSQGTDINAPVRHGSQPIHYAAEGGHIAMVEYLLSQGADINASDRHGRQPIHYAAQRGHIPMLEYLLGQGADINAQDNAGQRSINRAAQVNRIDAMRFLIGNGVQLGFEIEWKGLLLALSTRTESDSLPIRLYGQSVEINLPQLFRMAAGQNRLGIVRTILDNHRGILSADGFIQALLGAATAGHRDIVNLIYVRMNREPSLRHYVPQALSQTLVRAVAQRQLDVIYAIIQRESTIVQGSHYSELSSDFSLLNEAESFLRKVLERYSELQIASDERLGTYQRILQTFEHRRNWRALLIPASSETQSYFSLLPPEIAEYVLNMLTYNYLYDLVAPGAYARSFLASALSSLSTIELTAMLLVLQRHRAK